MLTRQRRRQNLYKEKDESLTLM